MEGPREQDKVFYLILKLNQLRIGYEYFILSYEVLHMLEVKQQSIDP